MRWPQFHKKIKPVPSPGHISLGWLCRPTAPGNPLGVEEGGEKSICHLSTFCLSLVSLTSPPTRLLPLVIRYSCYLVHPGSPGKSVPPPPRKQNPSTLSELGSGGRNQNHESFRIWLGLGQSSPTGCSSSGEHETAPRATRVGLCKGSAALHCASLRYQLHAWQAGGARNIWGRI